MVVERAPGALGRITSFNSMLAGASGLPKYPPLWVLLLSVLLALGATANMAFVGLGIASGGLSWYHTFNVLSALWCGYLLVRGLFY